MLHRKNNTMKNLHELLKADDKRIYISFNRYYSDDICLPYGGMLDVTRFLSKKQDRFFGNHLCDETNEKNPSTGNRTIQLSNSIFTVAQLFVETEGKIYRLSDRSGFLQMILKTNGLRAMEAEMKNRFRFFTLSREAMKLEVLKMEREMTKKIFKYTDRKGNLKEEWI